MKKIIDSFSTGNIRKSLFLLSDIIAVALAVLLSAVITGINSTDSFRTAIYSIPANILFSLIAFVSLKLYRSVWTFASIQELVNIIFGCSLSTAASVLFAVVFDRIAEKEVIMVKNAGYYVIYYFLLVSAVTAVRFGYRLLRILSHRHGVTSDQENVMIIGAGAAGAMLLNEFSTSRYINSSRAVCIIDDNKNKTGKYLQGVPIVGTREDIPWAVKKYGIKTIILAIPSISGPESKTILEICAKTDCRLKIMPGIYQIINGNYSPRKIRNVEISDLLGREQVKPDIEKIVGYISDKTILVTGGGGSIGSELCRQIARHGPKRLIIVDIYENSAYEIQQELRRKHPELDLVVLIASVRNTNRINRIFERYRPDIVYHAAAHKHVPLMETSPTEAIKNNVFGTLKTVRAADRYGVKKFVLISTDKAVNPTNVMGATKRICEMIVQTYNNRSETEFVAVRFGNVLGSNGSVIPLFKKQIEEGGPVLVTHPDIIRYFMTIPEAVSLVLSAGSYAKGGEIFVLDMGAPVRILDLATNLIKLSGYTPNVDIKIEFTGLRPGEKLYEELLMDEEGLQDTENKLIHIGKPINIDEEKFLSQLDGLYKVITKEPHNARKLISEIVPTYTGNAELKND